MAAVKQIILQSEENDAAGRVIYGQTGELFGDWSSRLKERWTFLFLLMMKKRIQSSLYVGLIGSA